MKASLPVLLLLTMAIAPVRADSIDDAEAKRRGVPVAQVQAENALASEKRKTAELEKQLADLKKQYAELTGTSTGDAASSGASPDTPASPALTADGPRKPSPLYDDLVKRYLDGDWRTLAADLAAKQKEIAAMPAGNAADLAYIRQTVAESRPDWWVKMRDGTATQFKQTVWKQPVTVTHKDGGVGFMGMAMNGNTLVATLGWPSSHMDSTDAMSLADVGLAMEGDFHRADGIDQSIWNMLGGVAVVSHVGTDKVKALAPDQKVQLNRYAAFWQNVTSAYYATPSGRRIVCVMSLASFEAMNDTRPDWAGRRPLGAMLMAELKLHKYGSVQPSFIAGLKPDMPEAEGFFAKPILLAFVSAHLTLAEDRTLRDAIKSFGEANMDWTKEKLSLPANLAYDLDPAKDADLRKERMTFVMGPAH